MLPPSQRCKDQTTKTATGPYKRENLLKFLEDKAKSEKDWDDVVPFAAGLKRGKVGDIFHFSKIFHKDHHHRRKRLNFANLGLRRTGREQKHEGWNGNAHTN